MTLDVAHPEAILGGQPPRHPMPLAEVARRHDVLTHATSAACFYPLSGFPAADIGEDGQLLDVVELGRGERALVFRPGIDSRDRARDWLLAVLYADGHWYGASVQRKHLDAAYRAWWRS